MATIMLSSSDPPSPIGDETGIREDGCCCTPDCGPLTLSPVCNSVEADGVYNVTVHNVVLSGNIHEHDCISDGGTIDFNFTDDTSLEDGGYACMDVEHSFDPDNPEETGCLNCDEVTLDSFDCEFTIEAVCDNRDACDSFDNWCTDLPCDDSACPDEGFCYTSAEANVNAVFLACNTGISAARLSAFGNFQDGFTFLCGTCANTCSCYNCDCNPHTFCCNNPDHCHSDPFNCGCPFCGYVTCYVVGDTEDDFIQSFATWENWDDAIARSPIHISANLYSKDIFDQTCGDVNCDHCNYHCFDTNVTDAGYFECTANLEFDITVDRGPC